MTATVCVVHGCPEIAVHRGRCVVHRLSEAQRGYGRAWRAIRAAVRGPRCEACGSVRDLTVDHIVPQSMGGTNERANLRTLCRRCHGRLGARSDRPLPPGGDLEREAAPRDTPRPIWYVGHAGILR